ncbi:hypothetical protein GCK32_019723, partial [Trichostrongylus colubriformis]
NIFQYQFREVRLFHSSPEELAGKSEFSKALLSFHLGTCIVSIKLYSGCNGEWKAVQANYKTTLIADILYWYRLTDTEFKMMAQTVTFHASKLLSIVE